MDPTSANGELQSITQTDLRALDAIGWNRSAASYSSTAVPEPANYLGTLILAAFGVKIIVNRRQKRVESIAVATSQQD